MTLTPEQFNKIALKEDLDEVKGDVKEIKKDVKEMLTTMDVFAKKVEKVEQEQTANIGAHDRFEERITKLEHQPEAGAV